MSFSKIIGQDLAIIGLKNIISQGHVRGSYLFLGPDGVGKRTLAVEFAKAVNCASMKDDACDDCVPCNKITSNNHPDVFMIYPEGSSYSIKIDKIREIRYEASLKPYEGKKRVFIINNAEKMSTEAQNAFLKLLEEPPLNHILILTASNIAGLLPTVFSRCKILKFNLLNRSQIQQFLEKNEVEGKEAVLFSHMAMGSIGKAVAFKENNMILHRDRMVNNFFFRRSGLLKENILAEEINRDIEASLYMLLGWYRDLLISKFTQDQDELLNIDRFEEISSYAGRFSREKLQNDLLSIMDTMERIRKNINPKIALFNMAVELKKTYPISNPHWNG